MGSGCNTLNILKHMSHFKSESRQSSRYSTISEQYEIQRVVNWGRWVMLCM